MPDFTIPTLMPIDSPREVGLVAPLMRQHFDVPGLMVLQHPRAETEATLVSPYALSLSNAPVTYEEALLSYAET